MAWIRLEDTFPEHTKIDAAGGDAAWLHVCGIGHCNRNRTDGFIPTERVPRLSDRRQPLKLAERLVDVGLWERAEGGYVIHDYLDYNPTRAELEANDAKQHEAKAAAGKLGGIASGIARRKHKGNQKGSRNEAEGEAESKQNEAPSRPIPSHPDLTLASSEMSSSIADASMTDDDWVVARAIELHAHIEAQRNALPRGRARYRETTERNDWAEHYPTLTDYLAAHPGINHEHLAIAVFGITTNDITNYGNAS